MLRTCNPYGFEIESPFFPATSTSPLVTKTLPDPSELEKKINNKQRMIQKDLERLKNIVTLVLLTARVLTGELQLLSHGNDT
jgi:hypothetical protein